MRLLVSLLSWAALAGLAQAQTTVSDPPAAAAAAPAFTQEAVDKGREQFHRTCAQCHGRNMVNSGTTVYDLRKFPTEQMERFFNSVSNGKNNMPSFKESLDVDTIKLLWAYVATRGGKEL